MSKEGQNEVGAALEVPKEAPKRAVRGRTLSKGLKAPPEVRALVKQSGPEDTAPDGTTTAGLEEAKAVAASMFGAQERKGKAAVPKPVASKPVLPKPAVPKAVVPKANAKPKVEAKAEEEAGPQGDGEGEVLPKAVGAEKGQVLGLDGDAEAEAPEAEEDDDVDTMFKLIKDAQDKSPYETAVPDTYVPETRRGFSRFIKDTYQTYALPEGTLSVREGTKYYPYQAFIRDYVRQASPYRGILVYHGLGSGKTCSAIAAAEALFSTARKKIIVMTPFSLRKNFMQEVMFCGFRHFQLTNYWVPMSTKDATVVLFAQEVLSIPIGHIRTAKNIWIPDFRKSSDEANYSSLPSDDQAEIRKQILSAIEYNPATGSGRIQFINYNGITAKKLLELACEGKAFDDAVIVVDEIHNLVRLMQGDIDPYLIEDKKYRRKLPVETVAHNNWLPFFCKDVAKINESSISEPEKRQRKADIYQAAAKKYKRGYIFYRLLVQARNSKLVGLSGTPLINFPEELGILMNLLHGYTTVVEGKVGESGPAVVEEIKEIAYENPWIDFVEASQDIKSGGTNFLMTLLPEGIKKVDQEKGVERIAPEESNSVETTVEELKQIFEQKGKPIDKDVKVYSIPLLPPTVDEFRNMFVDTQTVDSSKIIKHWQILLTRLSGIISYYKGSQLELMPAVSKDVVVRVPFSKHAQLVYMDVRGEEVGQEMKKTGGAGELGEVWARVFEVGTKKTSNNYKMGSRQACNFAFPSDITRPKPTFEEQIEEANEDQVPYELDLLDEAAKLDPPPGGEAVPELNSVEEADEASASAVLGEDAAVEEVEEEMGGGGQLGGKTPEEEGGVAKTPEEEAKTPEGEGEEADSESDSEEKTPEQRGEELVDALEEVRDLATSATRAVLPKPLEAPQRAVAALEEASAAPKTGGLKGILAKTAADCKAGKKEGEPIKAAYERAKRCLKTIGKERLKLGGPNGLEEHSPKYAAMLTNINEAPGSSLVYSQFLDMEGIGIFRLAMEVNGFAAIDILRDEGGQMIFSPATKKSLKENPTQPRFITFSGAQDEEIRRANLLLFNARFNELAPKLKEFLIQECVLDESVPVEEREPRYINNHTGQLCRVICITSAGAEGLSLKNVRAVHIMEPYWNYVRLKQVKGRAIRIGSHLELPEDQRNVSIYTYISVYSDEAQVAKSGDFLIDSTIRSKDTLQAALLPPLKIDNPTGAPNYAITTDERIWIVSERKRQIIERLESIMKSAAIDCVLNKEQNKEVQCLLAPEEGDSEAAYMKSIGDFLYHPLINRDIEQSGKLVMKTTERTFASYKVNGKKYRFVEAKDAAQQPIFTIYADADSSYSKVLGTTKAKEGPEKGQMIPTGKITWIVPQV